MARYKTANDILNQVGVEVGLQKQSDTFSTADAAYKQLIAIANSCGVELLQQQPWNQLNKKHSIVTTTLDTGKYALPDDYAYMLDQTGWEKTNDTPANTLSAQEWTYLTGSNTTGVTVTALFRLNQGQFWLYPYADGVAVPDGLNITFEYISRNWVSSDGTELDQYELRAPSDLVCYEPYLFERLLKVRFLEARGFDTTAAVGQLQSAFNSWSGKDKGAPILNAAGRGYGARLLNGCNAPDTGYGNA